MNNTQSRQLTGRRIVAVAALLTAGIAAFSQAAPGDGQAARAPAVASGSVFSSSALQGPRTGITAPSKSIKLGFDIRGVVDKVHVKDNDVVREGQPVISLDATEQMAELKQLRLRADTKLQVAEAEQTFNVKKIDYEKKKSLYENKDAPGTAALFEVQTAEAEKNIAEIRIEQAKHEGDIAAAQADAQEARVARMNKTSPIDGIVRQVIIKPGEQVDETKPVVEIVDLDPLYVEVTLIEREAVEPLKLGDVVRVKYQGETQWRDATVDRIDTQSDPSAGTLPFRLSLPNPELRLGGATVEIQLPSDIAAAAAAEAGR